MMTTPVFDPVSCAVLVCCIALVIIYRLIKRG